MHISKKWSHFPMEERKKQAPTMKPYYKPIHVPRVSQGLCLKRRFNGNIKRASKNWCRNKVILTS